MCDLDLLAVKENLPQVLQFVDDKLASFDVSKKIITEIDVSVEEIFVNIASYAYTPDVGMATIQAEILEDPKRIEITFIDKGIPYNPLAKEDPDTTLSAEERQIGGLGIYMVKKSMDAMRYEHTDGQNILTLVKNI